MATSVGCDTGALSGGKTVFVGYGMTGDVKSLLSVSRRECRDGAL
jgi:hypothetical protein